MYPCLMEKIFCQPYSVKCEQFVYTYTIFGSRRRLKKNSDYLLLVYVIMNKRHELAQNFFSLILINLVLKIASNCE